MDMLNTYDMATPVFDSVKADLGIETMPLPAQRTHRDMMTAAGYYKWMKDVENGIVRGADGRAKKVPSARKR